MHPNTDIASIYVKPPQQGAKHQQNEKNYFNLIAYNNLSCSDCLRKRNRGQPDVLGVVGACGWLHFLPWYNRKNLRLMDWKKIIQQAYTHAKAQGLTQTQIAQKAGCTQKKISTLVNGKYQPLMGFALRFIEACGMEIEVKEKQIKN